MVSREGTDRIRLAFPELGEEELAEVRGVLESGALTMGPKVAGSTSTSTGVAPASRTTFAVAGNV